MITIPFKVPMAPVNSTEIPIGPQWRHQLKWDGERTIVGKEAGVTELYSKKLEIKNTRFNDIVDVFNQVDLGDFVLDGEACYYDGSRPNFGKVRLNKRYDTSRIYVAFDLLNDNGEDIRHLPLSVRYTRLKELIPESHPRILVSDMFADGEALWNWVVKHGWEGIVSKQLDSPYVEGKNHTYWYKRRNELRLTCDCVGVKITKGNNVSTLILRYKNKYVGQVSGLDQTSKKIILEFALAHQGKNPFLNFKPKYNNILWLAVPFSVKIAALEFTENGLLRQTKILGYGI